jgi:hypothetical protein
MDSLKLSDLSDREVLAIVDDVSRSDSWSTGDDIAEALGLEGPTRRQSVGTRLGWIKRLSGTVERHHKFGWWRLTSLGEDVVKGKLTAAEQRSLQRLEGAKLILATRELGTSRARTSKSLNNLMRREWMHQQERWR